MQPQSSRRHDPQDPRSLAQLVAADPHAQLELARLGMITVPSTVLSRPDLSAAQKLLWLWLWALAGFRPGSITTTWAALAVRVGRSERSLQPARNRRTTRPGPLQELVDRGAIQRQHQPGVELALYVVHPDEWPELKSRDGDPQRSLPQFEEPPPEGDAGPLGVVGSSGESFEAFTGESFGALKPSKVSPRAGGEGGASARITEEEEEEENSCLVNEQTTPLPPPPSTSASEEFTGESFAPVKASQLSRDHRHRSASRASDRPAAPARPAPAASQECSWFRAERRLRQTGLKGAAKAVLEARQRGMPAAVALAIAEFYDGHRGAWNSDQREEPGVIFHAIRAWLPGDDPGDWDLWPSTTRAFRARDAMTRQQQAAEDEQQRASADREELRRLLDRTRAHLAGLDDEEREQLVLEALAQHPLLYERWRERGLEAGLALEQIGRVLFPGYEPGQPK